MESVVSLWLSSLCGHVSNLIAVQSRKPRKIKTISMDTDVATHKATMAAKMLNTVMMVDTVREEEGVIVEAEETAVGEAEEATEQQCSVSSFQHQAALEENFGLRSKRTQGGKTLSLFDGSTGRFLDY